MCDLLNFLFVCMYYRSIQDSVCGGCNCTFLFLMWIVLLLSNYYYFTCYDEMESKHVCSHIRDITADVLCENFEVKIKLDS